MSKEQESMARLQQQALKSRLRKFAEEIIAALDETQDPHDVELFNRSVNEAIERMPGFFESEKLFVHAPGKWEQQALAQWMLFGGTALTVTFGLQ